MNNLEDQVKENPQIIQLNKLKDRLLNLNPRYNRKIRFFLSRSHAWDLAELLNKIESQITRLFLTSLLNLLFVEGEQEEVSFNLTKSSQLLKPEEQDKIEANLTKLRRNNQRIYQEKGHKSLFLGLFFLRGYFRNSQKKLQLINAPLIFCPADFEKNQQGNLILVISKLKKINYTLFYYLQKELSLNNEKVVNSLKKLENNKNQGDWTDYLDLLASEIRNLIAISSLKTSFSQWLTSWCEKPKQLSHELVKQNENSNTLLEPFVSLKVSWVKDKNVWINLTSDELTKDLKENELQITFNFCLTIDNEPNLSLFRNFEKIIQNYAENGLTNWPNSALNLLIGEKKDSFDLSSNEKAIESKQKTIYTPFPADPSQIHILKTIFQRFWGSILCVDGPPGTGKSQLICNLLANALVYQKKVLVICEKQVALKVIYDKLKSIGLDSSIIKINDLSQTAETYRNITNIIERKLTSAKIGWISPEEFSKIEEKKAIGLKKIKNYCVTSKEFYTNHQVPLNEVYLKRNISVKLTSLLVFLNQWVKNKEQLKNLKANLETYIAKFTEIFQKQKETCLGLRHLFLQQDNFKFNPINQIVLQELITDLLKELKGEKSTIKLLSRIWQISLIQKHGKSPSNYYLLKTKLTDLHDLIANHHLETLFSFLDIQDLKDFLEKCNNEKFLDKLQNFVDQEFLEIGELNLLFKSFDEDTSKNIKHFLEKVLFSQEFNYLSDYVKLIEQAVYFNWLKEIETSKKQDLVNWNWLELKNIHQIQKEVQKSKIKLAQQFIQAKQQENISKLCQDKNLRNEVNKKRRLTSLKKLFPSLLSYFPIWLTTPEVVASVTELQQPSFDFIVFDEASQMLLEKAVPILTRAKKCIVIGDEQQLPPTDFFKTYLGDEEEIWEEEEKEELVEKGDNIKIDSDDLEKNSNLLTYAKKYVPYKQELSLMWHYRSLYPELIDFSNQAFYRGNLQITQDCEARGNLTPIEYHHVKNGFWKNRENQAEAIYIAQLLDKLPSEKDIGIITFNQKQRDLVIDLVEEKVKSENIKNLEEIQGDERDIIIFSTGFAPDEEGKLRLSFGPLSQQGGEKRLNVAITRAKEKVIIVTSILPEDLKRITDDSKLQLGSKLFKKYLEYARACWQKDQEKMQEILEKSIPKIVNLPSLEEKLVAESQYDSLFEEEVHKELIKLDYLVKAQVGSIGYKIDLVIYHPQNNQAILGIECDGYYWHSKPTDIENDSYRQMILESKGWKIHRILSRDWWKDKEGEIERVKKEVEKELEPSLS